MDHDEQPQNRAESKDQRFVDESCPCSDPKCPAISLARPNSWSLDLGYIPLALVPIGYDMAGGGVQGSFERGCRSIAGRTQGMSAERCGVYAALSSVTLGGFVGSATLQPHIVGNPCVFSPLDVAQCTDEGYPSGVLMAQPYESVNNASVDKQNSKEHRFPAPSLVVVDKTRVREGETVVREAQLETVDQRASTGLKLISKTDREALELLAGKTAVAPPLNPDVANEMGGKRLKWRNAKQKGNKMFRVVPISKFPVRLEISKTREMSIECQETLTPLILNNKLRTSEFDIPTTKVSIKCTEHPPILDKKFRSIFRVIKSQESRKKSTTVNPAPILDPRAPAENDRLGSQDSEVAPTDIPRS
ncbi:hypothetical protein WN55_01526 [Dufourea novaeangliae]|uniref:Uncharacterized protein n=1 Tax=Dufourea novaeangliae TaxID=178035 RepID=A0A154PGA2_DUFNO|nr:hypothetical protein WN55_01526 [Dufourea novaeangliae]